MDRVEEIIDIIESAVDSNAVASGVLRYLLGEWFTANQVAQIMADVWPDETIHEFDQRLLAYRAHYAQTEAEQQYCLED